MSLTITFLGHSGFLFNDGTNILCVDPFLTGNELATHSADEIECSYIALTHGHDDHTADAVSIAQRNGATVIAPFELANLIADEGVETVEMGNPGGRVYTDFGYVAFTPAIHSSSYKGQYAGPATGLIIRMGDKCIYHAGDTALFSDMKLIGEVAKPDVSCIPVGDRFTMNPKLGSRAAEYVAAPISIPIHYKTFPLLVDDISEFQPQGIEVKALAHGESFELF